MSLYDTLRNMQRNDDGIEVDPSSLSEDEWLLLHDLGKPWNGLINATCVHCKVALSHCAHNPIYALLPQPEHYYQGVKWVGSALWFQALHELVLRAKSRFVRIPEPKEPKVKAPPEPKSIKVKVERIPRRKFDAVDATERALLCEEYKQGSVTIADLSANHNIAQDAVSAILKAANVPMRKVGNGSDQPKPTLTDVQLRRAAILYDRGSSLAELQEKFKVDSFTISKQLKASGVRIAKGRR